MNLSKETVLALREAQGQLERQQAEISLGLSAIDALLGVAPAGARTFEAAEARARIGKPKRQGKRKPIGKRINSANKRRVEPESGGSVEGWMTRTLIMAIIP